MILTRGELNRATLARQLLLARADLPVAEAIEKLCGLQAQEPRPPYLGLWTRLAAFDRAALSVALHDRSVVRATMMRGTLHTMSARDYLAFRSALQPVLDGGLAALGDRANGLDPAAVLPAARRLLAERPRTFTELRALLAAEFPGVNERALGFTARMRLPLAMVPADARWGYPAVASFTPADLWLGAQPSPSASPADLVLRYLAAFGPATVADAAAWSGLRGLGPVFEELRPGLAVFADERGRELFDLPGAPRPPADVAAPVRLLPEFDNLNRRAHGRSA